MKSFLFFWRGGSELFHISMSPLLKRAVYFPDYLTPPALSLSLSLLERNSCDYGDLSTSRTDGSERCDVLEVRRGTNPLSGTFRVGLDSTDHLIMSKRGAFVSGPIAHNAFASAADTNGDGTSMEEILEAMPNVGDVEVSRVPVNLGGNSGGYSWLVTFLRDADSPCEEKDDATGLCNSPGTPRTCSRQVHRHVGNTPLYASRHCSTTVVNLTSAHDVLCTHSLFFFF